MKEYVREYVEHNGRRCELSGVDIETDSLVGLFARLSVSIGLLAIVIELAFFIFNIDSGIVDLDGKGFLTILGILAAGGAMAAFTTFISFMFAVPIYKLIYKGKRAQKFRFKVQ